MALKVARLINLLLAGVLVANEFGTWTTVHPALGALPTTAHIQAEQALTRRYGTILSCLPVLVLLGDRRSPAFRRTLSGMLCFLTLLGVTFAGNMPINRQVLELSPAAPPADRPRLRARWDRWHTLRNVLNFAGFCSICLGALSAPRSAGDA